jgi:hypothetical protein
MAGGAEGGCGWRVMGAGFVSVWVIEGDLVGWFVLAIALETDLL